jgi:hypothetical protein
VRERAGGLGNFDPGARRLDRSLNLAHTLARGLRAALLHLGRRPEGSGQGQRFLGLPDALPGSLFAGPCDLERVRPWSHCSRSSASRSAVPGLRGGGASATS